MHDFVSLIEDHDAMDALADRLIASARPGQAAPAICRALMTDLAALIGRLFGHAASLQSAALIMDAAPRLAEQIGLFRAELAEMADIWQGYVAQWDEDRIAAERRRYSGETTDLMTALKLSILRDLGWLGR